MVKKFDTQTIETRFSFPRRLGAGKYGIVYKALPIKVEFPAKQNTPTESNSDVFTVETEMKGEINPGSSSSIFSEAFALKVINTRTWENHSFNIGKSLKDFLRPFGKKKKLRAPECKTNYERAIRELRYLDELSCPYIIEIKGYCEKQTKHKYLLQNLLFSSRAQETKELWLCTELLSTFSGSVCQKIALREENIDRRTLETVLHSVAKAMVFLYDKGFSHFDLKGENILLKLSESKAKHKYFGYNIVEKAVLCDFGACTKNKREDIPIWRGTFSYLSPEYLRLCETILPFENYMRKKYKDLDIFDRSTSLLDNLLDGKVDVWTFGLLIMCFILGTTPFRRLTPKIQTKKMLKILNEKPETCIFGDSGLEKEFFDLMEGNFSGFSSKLSKCEGIQINLKESYFPQLYGIREKKFKEWFVIAKGCLNFNPRKRISAMKICERIEHLKK
eukprot:maker-scaffold_13-snap-gene-1.47-mRNA-1 protein AED:0.00 eAED:0.00 QI:24/1/1/1/0/0.5/2/124/446